MHNIAVFASGTATNLKAILQHVKRGFIPCPVKLIVTDNINSGAVTLAYTYSIPLFYFNPKAYISKAEYEKTLLAILKRYNIYLIVLAGYMRIITNILLSAYPNRILNIHPSLLPSFKGINAVEQALKAGVKITGTTVHIVTEDVDSGPIIYQLPVFVKPDDTPQTLHNRIKALEHKLYPLIIKTFCLGYIKLKNNTVIISNG